jgi:hypothetical protein
MWRCVDDGGFWPSGAALRGKASNRLMLRWLKTVVVSDEEKALALDPGLLGRVVRVLAGLPGFSRWKVTPSSRSSTRSPRG